MKLSNKKKYSISEVLKELKPDTKAVVWYDDNGLADIKVESGDLPTEAELDALGNVKALEQAKKEKCFKVNEARDKSINKPYKWPEPIDGKEREFSVNLLDELNAAFVLDDGEAQPWICEDNEYPGVTLTKQQMKQICRHIRARKTTLIHEGRRIKNEILALNTVEEVEAYNIEL